MIKVNNEKYKRELMYNDCLTYIGGKLFTLHEKDTGNTYICHYKGNTPTGVFLDVKKEGSTTESIEFYVHGHVKIQVGQTIIGLSSNCFDPGVGAMQADFNILSVVSSPGATSTQYGCELEINNQDIYVGSPLFKIYDRAAGKKHKCYFRGYTKEHMLIQVWSKEKTWFIRDLLLCGNDMTLQVGQMVLKLDIKDFIPDPCMMKVDVRIDKILEGVV